MEDRSHPVSLSFPVAWGEQDLFGHVNNIVYFRYFESVRMHLLERIGVLRSHNEKQQGVILASTTCDFKRPVTWPCDLIVRTGVSAVGNTSFTMTYSLTDTAGTVMATGSSVQVMFDYNKGEKMPIPEGIRTAIEKLMS
jgi:acyl-CoA thioester hydrolase